MFTKLSVFALLMAVIVKDVSAGTIVNPNLENEIEEMWKKVNIVKKEMLDVDADSVSNKTSSAELDPLTDVFEQLVQNVTKELVIHFEEVEKKARETGKLKYHDPEYVAAILLTKHKDTFYELVKTEIMGSTTLDEKAKKALLEVIQEGINHICKCLQDFVTEIENHPEVWDDVDPNYFWRNDDSSEEASDRPQPADDNAKAAFNRMDKLLEECKMNILGTLIHFLSVIVEFFPESLTEPTNVINSAENLV